ncbi:DNA cytosine methyltransferase, partial [Virgibacillus soli]|uniref:DNA cytosine methyltransferase n=1 Tax=Paracerasibacillus soli TaxID=480284 RepID=UPI0035E6C504
AGQGTTRDTSKSSRETSNICLNDQGGSRMDVTKEVTATLRAKSNHPPLVFDNHGRDARIKGPVDVAQTVVSLYGTGGNNQPFVLEKPKTFDIRLTSEGTVNVRANIYESDVSRTIDTSGNSPNSNQGGIAIVSNKDDVSKGKQSTYSSSKNSHFTSAEKELASTLVATDYKDPPLVNIEDLIVRRLTPTECGRLQGFPDGWCDNLGEDNPSDEEINFWEKVWETHRQLISKNKRPKTRKQIIKWLSQPHSDTAEYKMWGNGVALPCVIYVLTGISIQLNKD